MIVDGRQIAEEVYGSITACRGLTLGIVLAGTDPVTDSFVRIKERAAKKLEVTLRRVELPKDATTHDALTALDSLATCDGVIVQLPLPATVDTEQVISMIPPHQDVDGVSPSPLVRAPVAEAVLEILNRSHVPIEGAVAVVLGEGRLVGRPSAQMLRERGAIVTVVTRESDTFSEIQKADILVLGAGQVGLVKPEHIKEGVVLIDAGTSEQGGKIGGDADPLCASKCAVFSPVPGGVGPVAVAMIFKNLLELSKK